MTYILRTRSLPLLRNGKYFLIFLITLAFFWPNFFLAAEAPTLTSPADNSTVNKSVKLVWQYDGECVENGSCFNIQVDNSADFGSNEKSTYTNNFSYSPQGLAEGDWNWRVKAKDKSEKWSDWSKPFKFSISSQAAPSAPSTNSPASTSTPQPSTGYQKAESVFSIKDAPSEINSSQEFEVSVSLKLPDKINSVVYLKGAFKKESSSNYFGQTLASDWVGNSEKYSKQYKITTGPEGNWEGKIKVRPDADDSGFDGTGQYIFKIARYSDTGFGPTWSNEVKIKINAVSTPEPSPTEDPKKEIPEEKEIDITPSLVKLPAKNYEIKIASVAGEATMSNNISLEERTRVLEDKKINWLLVILGFGTLIGSAGFAYFKFHSSRHPRLDRGSM